MRPLKLCFPCCWARSSVAKPCRRLESPATFHLVLLARQVARPCNRNDILDAFAGLRIWERRTRSNLYTPFFPRNSQNYQEKYPKGTRFSCKPWGFQHEGLSLRHNQTQSYTITCADHMISQKDTFFELPFFHFEHFYVSIFGADWRFQRRVHPNQSHGGSPKSSGAPSPTT